jgi:hypothetical protein
MRYVVVITAADGTESVAGPFTSLLSADGWAANLELQTEGDLGGYAHELEDPEVAMAVVTTGRKGKS